MAMTTRKMECMRLTMLIILMIRIMIMTRHPIIINAIRRKRRIARSTMTTAMMKMVVRPLVVMTIMTVIMMMTIIILSMMTKAMTKITRRIVMFRV